MPLHASLQVATTLADQRKTQLHAWASYQVRKIAGCAWAGNAGNVFPATDFKWNGYLAIPACIRARASRTCRDACRESLTWSGGGNVSGIPGACATCNFAQPVRGPLKKPVRLSFVALRSIDRAAGQPCLSIVVGDFYTLLHCTALYIWSSTRKGLVTVWNLFHNQHLWPFMSQCRCQKLYDASHKTY